MLDWVWSTWVIKSSVAIAFARNGRRQPSKSSRKHVSVQDQQGHRAVAIARAWKKPGLMASLCLPLALSLCAAEVPSCLKVLRLRPERRFCRLGDLSKEVGQQQQESQPRVVETHKQMKDHALELTVVPK